MTSQVMTVYFVVSTLKDSGLQRIMLGPQSPWAKANSLKSRIFLRPELRVDRGFRGISVARDRWFYPACAPCVGAFQCLLFTYWVVIAVSCVVMSVALSAIF